MSSSRPIVFYFRSLDTSGSDEFKIGPIRIGSFSSHFEEEFENLPLDFVPVLNMGAGSLFEQADRAKIFLKKNESFSQNLNTIHFLGHSAGGLIAKMVAADSEFNQGLRSVITIGTPHKSCKAAEWAASMEHHSPRLHHLLKWIGYDITLRRSTFESFKAVSEEEFLIPETILTGAIVCAPSPKTWSWFFRFIHKFDMAKNLDQPSDGLISKESQYFGKHTWEFDLDHLQQIGYGGQSEEFKRLCQFLEKVWLDTKF